MSEPVKKRLCWNCEGSVAQQLETCPYCGVYLSPTEHNDFGKNSFQENNLLSPPYPQESSKGSRIPAPPYQGEAEGHMGEAAEPEETSLLSTLLFFLSGGTFLLFGLTLWLFSQEGRLTLSWNSDWGLMFFIMALPLLFLGFRGLSKLT